MSPADVGLPALAGRRVPGLRREEVAALAGISTNWYTLFERGRRLDVSAPVVRAIAQALRLDSHETAYLFVVVANAMPMEQLGALGSGHEAEAIAGILRDDQPRVALAYDDEVLVVGLSPLARRLLGFRGRDAEGTHTYRHVVTDPELRRRLPRWEHHAAHAAAVMRYFAARRRSDPPIVAELLRDRHFAVAWERQEVHTDVGWRTPVELVDDAVGTLRLTTFGLMLPGGGRLLHYFGAEPEDRERLARLQREL